MIKQILMPKMSCKIMNFSEFEQIVSADRLHRYVLACDGDRERAIMFYRCNVSVSLEMFAVVGAFEIALRNSIDRVMSVNFGADWLRNAILPGGIFDTPRCCDHAKIIRSAYYKLLRKGTYTHTNLLSKMEFGIWKYMFSSPQYRATNRVLLKAFPNKPSSNREIQYNNTYIFNELDRVNSLRNRIAHHEPICFPTGLATITTSYVGYIYEKIMILFQWLGIDSTSYLDGIDCVKEMCDEIDRLKA